MSNDIFRQLRYRFWLAWHWVEQIAFPFAKRMSKQAKKQFYIALLIISVGVPVNYYVFSASNRMEAVAAVEMTPSQPGEDIPAPAVLQEGVPANIDTHVDGAPQDTAVSGEQNSVATGSALDHAKKHMDPAYVCPMHPEVVSKEPGTCPICGMDLVPLEMNGEAGVVQLSSTVINALGVRLDKVERRTIFRKIDSVGYISYNENNLRTVSLRTDAWVERLAVKAVGTKVQKGDLLFEVYAPQLVNAQEEFVQAIALDGGDGSLVDASKERLRALGVSDQQIENLSSSKKVEQLIKVFAPQDGVIMDLQVREGMFVSSSEPVVSLADLSTVWLLVDIFESQASWVEEGLQAEARLAFIPNKTWEGEVEFVYPSLDAKTRSVKARIRVENPDFALKPNMYADISIFASPKRKVLTVPREAVIRQGNQARVITALGDGRFKPAVVHIGTETEDRIEILGGLEEGQDVVVSSQFLIDSESSMRAALMRMAGGG